MTVCPEHLSAFLTLLLARELVYRAIDWLVGENSAQFGRQPPSCGAYVSALRGSAMTTREFKVGQYVYYHPASRVMAKGRYVVIAVFQLPDGRARYLIRGEDEPSTEYTASVKELREAPGPR